MLYLMRLNALPAVRYVAILLFSLVLSSPLYAQTENEVYCYIKKAGIKHPEVVLKQAIYESGHFKSNIFKKRNNLFGFRHNKYIVFDSWQSCIDYYKRWQDKYYKDDSIEYYKFLQHRNFSGRLKFRYDTQLKHTKIKDDLVCLDDKNENTKQ
ncbi:glucosaminidase domain-containing protein [Parasediminibacterium sp. JCM 36343]|uniref:glucosaminidase domain-containing protein n=1 Tax=Parasediminibacterium sp. JCM 36343 TaxID=3374279 RepID=UPI00397D0D9D